MTETDAIRRELERAMGGRAASPRTGGSFTGVPSAEERGRHIASIGPEVQPLVLALLFEEGDPLSAAEHESLLIALRHFGDPGVVPILCEYLDSDAPESTKGWTAHTLGHLGDAAAGESLTGHLMNRSHGIGFRQLCVQALSRLGVSAASAGLLNLLRSRSEEPAALRADCAYALASLAAAKTTETADALRRELAVEENREVQLAILWSLGRVDEGTGLPALERLSREHEDLFVRESAAAAADAVRRRLASTGG